MDLKLAKKGEQYRIFLTPEGYLCKSPTIHTIITTIIAESNSGAEVILGWKKGEDVPRDVSNRANPSSSYTYVPDHAQYVYGKAVTRDLPIGVKIINGVDGFPCSKCDTFCQFALPNQANGTFICYSCRRGW